MARSAVLHPRTWFSRNSYCRLPKPNVFLSGLLTRLFDHSTLDEDAGSSFVVNTKLSGYPRAAKDLLWKFSDILLGYLYVYTYRYVHLRCVYVSYRTKIIYKLRTYMWKARWKYGTRTLSKPFMEGFPVGWRRFLDRIQKEKHSDNTMK